jgi:nicotinate-nucleotide pyrophosphorylase (carboxylating)
MVPSCASLFLSSALIATTDLFMVTGSPMMDLSPIRSLLEQELRIDRVNDDVTSRLLDSAWAEGTVFARESGVFSGEDVCRAYPPGTVAVTALLKEGAELENGTAVARLEGPAADCLSAERTLLNLLSHLCGVATLTRDYVRAVAPHPTRILATRKTLPLLRDLQLQAVRSGGGHIHRRSLSDGILVKDNHLVFIAENTVVSKAKHQRSPLHRVEVEVQSMEQLERLLQNPPDVVMLDNFDLEMTRIAIAKIQGRCEVEVSGGMDLEKTRAVAALGVDYISVGKLTHSAPALNLSLDIVRRTK